jgi:hypothetical protein
MEQCPQSEVLLPETSWLFEGLRNMLRISENTVNGSYSEHSQVISSGEYNTQFLAKWQDSQIPFPYRSIFSSFGNPVFRKHAREKKGNEKKDALKSIH